MAEYIEREAAYSLAKKICDAIRNGDYHPATFGKVILDMVDDFPAADVAPVRQGRWNVADDVGDCCYRCSECGFLRDAYDIDTENYCPNCGAAMYKEIG